MTSSQRLRRLLAGLGLLLAAGGAYALWVSRTGLAIPCPFRAVTGWKCPGCGVTTLCLALLRLDLAAAWAANPVLLVLLPLIALLLIRMAAGYVRRGFWTPARWESALLWALVALLLVWGAARNLIP